MGVLQLLMGDLYSTRRILGLYLAIIVAQALFLALSFRGSVMAEPQHFAIAAVGWLVQFVLTVRLIQRRIPADSRDAGQSAERGWFLISAATIAALGLFVFFPPWSLGRALLIANGFSPWPRTPWEVVTHVGLIASFGLVGLVTGSTRAALLLAAVLAGAGHLAHQVPQRFPQFVGTHVLLLPIPVSSALSVGLTFLFFGALASANGRGRLVRPLALAALAMGFACSSSLVFHFPQRAVPPARNTESVRFRLNVTRAPVGSEQYYIGELLYEPRDPQEVLVVTNVRLPSLNDRWGAYVPFTSARRIGSQISVPGIGWIGQANQAGGPSGLLGPISSHEFDESSQEDRVRDLVAHYDIHRLRSESVIPAAAGAHASGPGWRLGVVDRPASWGRYPTRRLMLTRQDQDLWPGTLDTGRADLSVETWLTFDESVAWTLWPISAGIEQGSSILIVFRESEPGITAPAAEVALLRVTPVAQGETHFDVAQLKEAIKAQGIQLGQPAGNR